MVYASDRHHYMEILFFSARKHLGYEKKDGVGVIKFDTPDSKVLGILLSLKCNSDFATILLLGITKFKLLYIKFISLKCKK